MDQLIQITTTSDDRNELERIAARLVENQLAACCQISGPIVSFYRWQGQLESTAEWICSIKTSQRLFRSVSATINQLHHYDVPQIVAVDVCSVSEEYRTWLLESVTPDSADQD